MKVFADTSFFLALIEPEDEAHERALAVSRGGFTEVLVTEFVIVELGAALSKPHERGDFLALYHVIERPPYRIISASSDLVRQGIALFESRPDKAWSLTDCISFEVMSAHAIVDALTTDHHFHQAGFRALLLEG